MGNSRRAMLKSAVGLGAATAGAMAVTATPAQAAGSTGTGWLNVKDFGALGDDSTDDQPAIQAAINAAGQGSTVYFPPGRYRLATPITVSLGVTLRGDWAPHFTPRTDMVDSYLRPGITNFTGRALIIINPAPVNGPYQDSAYRGGPRLSGLALNGKNTKDSTGAPIDAVYLAPGVKDVGLDKVTAWHFTGNGISAQGAAGLQLNQVVSSTNAGHGFTWGDPGNTGDGAVDVDLFQCYSQGNGGHGFDLLNPNAVTLVDCRSEWNAQYGYTVSGTTRSLMLVGCNTDRSGWDGFHLTTASGSRPVQLIGCLAKRDGAAGSGYSGFSVTGATTQGALLAGCAATTGLGDDGGGPASPSYGVTTSALSPSAVVTLAGGEFVGVTAPFNDAGMVLVRQAGVTAATGSYSSTSYDKSDVQVLNGASDALREVQFWSRGKGQRWALRVGNTENGNSSGSDFSLVRYADDGTMDAPITVNRSSGFITLGQAGVPGGAVTVNANNSPGVNLQQAKAGGQGYAVTSADTASRAFQAQVVGDAINRLVIDPNGTQFLGPGGNTPRDTTWGRLGVAQIGSADSDLVAAKAGRGLKVKEGTDAKLGTLTLNGATPVVVPTKAVTANSRIFLTVQAPAGTPSGIAFVASRIAGTSFSVQGTAGDLSTVAWMIVEPA